MERRRPQRPCAAGKAARMVGLMLVMFVATSLIAQATAQVPGPTTTDRKQCNAGCAKSCSPVKGTKPSQYSCKTCKRGFARQGGNAAQCNYCSPGYATRIDPLLPKSVRRGFVACKQEPCKRCSACPQGTTSAGGARGTWQSTYPNGTISTCGSATPVQVNFNVFTTPVNNNGTFSCNAAFGPTLKTLIETSMGNQGAVGTNAVIGAPSLTVDNACQWPVQMSYLGNPSLGATVVAASGANDCQYSSDLTQTGGLCTALPFANAAGQNLCVAFTATYASNYVLCSGMGVQGFSQVVSTTPITTSLPVTCNNTFGGIIAGLMATSLKSRNAVAGVNIQVVGSCSVSADFSLAIYTFSVNFFGDQSLEDTLKGESATPINSVNYTGGVCLAYPNAAGTENLCRAFVDVTPKGFVITASSIGGGNSSVIPSSVVALGVTTAQVTSQCTPTVSAILGGSMQESLVKNPSSPVPLTNETTVNYDSCQAVNVSSSNFAIVGNTLYVVYEGKVLSGVVPSEMAAQLGAGGLDLASIGVDAPGHRRRLLDSGDQADLFIVIYNMLIKMIANTASGTVTQADIDAFSQALVAKATTDTDGLNAAFPLPGGIKLTVQVTTLASTQGIGVSVLVATNLALNQSAPNVTSSVWAGVKQAIVVTAYNTNPDDQCLNPDVRQAVVAGIIGSFTPPNPVAPSATLPTTNVLSCAKDADGNSVFTMMTSFKGTAADNAALIAAASAAAFSVCTSAYPQLCPKIEAATGVDGATPQQAICILASGTCPPACPTGTWRNLQFTTTCDYALGGYYIDPINNGTKCPEDTFAPNQPARPIANGQADIDTCSPCADGLTTDGATGQVACNFVFAGYFYDGSAKECPVNTYSPINRLIKYAANCTACASGTSTYGLTGQSACQPAGLVPPGNFWDGSANQPCPAGTFAPIARAQADASSCWPCESLVAFNDRNPITGVPYALVALPSAPGATSCPCPANTYFLTGSNPSVASAACVACPQGTTSNAPGAVGLAACAANCKGGYWGNPSNAAYGGQCRACPTVAPGNASSATAGNAPAPVAQASCSACSYTSSGSGAPATCTTCSGAGVGGAACDMCIAGYWGNAGTCTQCPPEWSSVAVPATVTMTGSISDCGGCAKGQKGAACGDACPGFVANITGSAYVLPLIPTTGDDNCVIGCPPGTGITADGKACVACGTGMYSPGTRVAGKHPVCQTCPPGSEPADGQTRCKTLNKAAIDATEEGLFDEFD